MTPRSEENAHPGTRSSSSPPQQTSSRSLPTTPGPGHSGKHSNPPHKAPAATSTSQTNTTPAASAPASEPTNSPDWRG